MITQEVCEKLKDIVVKFQKYCAVRSTETNVTRYGEYCIRPDKVNDGVSSYYEIIHEKTLPSGRFDVEVLITIQYGLTYNFEVYRGPAYVELCSDAPNKAFGAWVKADNNGNRNIRYFDYENEFEESYFQGSTYYDLSELDYDMLVLMQYIKPYLEEHSAMTFFFPFLVCDTEINVQYINNLHDSLCGGSN